MRIHLPMPGIRVLFPVWEDPMCRGAAKPVHPNSEPASYSRQTAATEPTCLEPVLHNKRSHHNEKPVHCNQE